jgi:hypothetical protein
MDRFRFDQLSPDVQDAALRSAAEHERKQALRGVRTTQWLARKSIHRVVNDACHISRLLWCFARARRMLSDIDYARGMVRENIIEFYADGRVAVLREVDGVYQYV